MFRKLIWSCAALALLGLSARSAAPIPVGAGDSPLAAIPAEAPIVIQVKGVDRVTGRVKAFLNAASPEFGPMIAAQLDARLRDMPDGRKLAGLAPNGPLFIALLDFPEGGEPPMAIIARVTKYAEFRDGLLTAEEKKAMKNETGIDMAEMHGKEMFFIDRQDYAIVTTTKDVALMLAKKFNGLDGKLSKDLAAKLMDNDLGVYVDLAAVNAKYGDNIRQGRDMLLGMMDQMAGQMDKAQVEMAKKMYGGMFQAILDGRSMVTCLDFRPEGLAIRAHARVGAETDSNAVLKDQKPSELAALAKLPAGQTVYTGAELSPETMKTFMSMMQGMTEGDEGMKSAVEKLIAAKGKANYSASSYPAATITVQEYADPQAAVAGTLGMFKAMGEGTAFGGAMLKGAPEVKVDAQTLNGIKFSEYKLTWDLDKMMANVPGGGDAAKAAMTRMMGEDLHGWIGTDGKRVVQVTAKDWDAAKAKLTGFLAGTDTIGASAAFQSTRKVLPASTSMMFMMDAGPIALVMADVGVSMMKGMGGAGLPFPLPDAIKPVPTVPVFIGAAVTLQPENGSVDIYFPSAAVPEIKKVVQQLFMGGN